MPYKASKDAAHLRRPADALSVAFPYMNSMLSTSCFLRRMTFIPKCVCPAWTRAAVKKRMKLFLKSYPWTLGALT